MASQVFQTFAWHTNIFWVCLSIWPTWVSIVLSLARILYSVQLQIRNFAWASTDIAVNIKLAKFRFLVNYAPSYLFVMLHWALSDCACCARMIKTVAGRGRRRCRWSLQRCHLTCAFCMCMLCFGKQTLSQHHGYTTQHSQWHHGREAMSVKHDSPVSVSAQAACFPYTNLWQRGI